MGSSATLSWVKGDPGVGVPAGGSDEQILAKASGDDYDTEWVNAGGGGGVVADTFTNRPAAATEGLLFLPTDGYYPTRDTGAAWVVQNPLGLDCTNPPSAGSFTKVAGSTETTLVADGDGLLLTSMGTNSASRNNVAFMVALPAAPYTFTVGMEVTRLMMNLNTFLGLCLSDGTDSGSSKFITYPLVTQSATVINDLFQTWTLINTYSGLYYNVQHIFHPFYTTRLWMRIVDNNTNRICSFSQDRVRWVELHSISRTDFTTPTHCGLFFGAVTAVVATNLVRAQAKIFDWTLA